jgi:Cu-Zn family superoxide dismutase
MALVAPLTMITGCVAAIDAGSVAVGSATSANQSLVVSGTFLPYREGATAITYDENVVPAGATARVAISTTSAGMRVELTTNGMVPRRSYGAHLHTQPCTAVPDQAGPHYQHMHDPVKPSVDPAYANPHNEIWLDFTADTTGAASATSAPDWVFPAGEPARSLVVHTQQTRTSPGEAGTAGARVACLTLPVV